VAGIGRHCGSWRLVMREGERQLRTRPTAGSGVAELARDELLITASANALGLAGL